MRWTSWRRMTLLALLFVSLGGGRAHAQMVDPAYRFRTLRTEHFTIYFHQNEESVAQRLAAIAETAWREFDERPGVAPPPHTHVVLADQSESSNGFATPFPRNTIFLQAVMPSGTSLLNQRDWLRSLFVHEFAHIVHLDRSEGWARLVRGVFGRTPWAFPNITLPSWHIEGLATWEEGAGREIGRFHIGDFRAIVNEAARAGRLEPIDRVNGGLTDWPGGYGGYAYGLGFHSYLADRFGADRFATLADRTAGSLPWLGPLAFKRVYGESLGSLWRDYQDSLTRQYRPVADATAGRRLTQHRYMVLGPRYLPRACAECPGDIAYSVRTPDERPAIYHLRLDTLDRTRLTSRILGSTMGVSRGTLYFDQQELHRNVGTYADLFAMDRATGAVTRLTSGTRLTDPDLSPDGRTLAAVQNRPGQRDLVLIDVANLWSDRISSPDHPSIRRIASAPDTHFNAPRWSPDGRALVVERQQGTAPPDLVIVDVTGTAAPRVLAGGPDMRWATPTWHPNGRVIVASAATGDGPFNVYAIDLQEGRAHALTNTTGGATWPDVSPDGSTLVYVGYSTDGFDLYEVPYAPDASRSFLATAASGTIGAEAPSDSPATTTIAPYRPWPTLLPTSWTPVITSSSHQVRVGALVGGRDVLGYHAYGAAASWPIATRTDAPDDAAVPDWSASYVYQRWQPRLFAAASRETSFFTGEPTDSGLATASTMVERSMEAGVMLPISRFRTSHALQASMAYLTDVRRVAAAERSRNRSAAKLIWRFSSAQHPSYAISPERGATAGVALETVRRAFGATADGTTFTVDGRAYLPGLGAHHVLALRAATGTSRGSTDVSRVFLLGGGAANATAGGLGSDAMSLLRGFGSSTFAGRHLALANADYRWPLARPQRGVGAWPVFLHSVHAAVVADMGHVWTGAFRASDLKTSIGAELSANVVLGYALPLTMTVGAAHGRDGSGTVASGVRIYTRLGYAF